MIHDPHGYHLFHKFIETYSSLGFRDIDRNSALLVELEELTEVNNQFFHVADLIQAKITWASKRCTAMMGIGPEELNAFHFFEATHPEDIEKHTLGRAKMFSLANDLYKAEKGKAFLSIDIRIRNEKGEYPNLLFQLYFMFGTVPYKTVHLFQVHTNIDSFKKRKNFYTYYAGNDLSLFRYPDDELLNIGNPLSSREFEIVNLIEAGLSTEQIAEKLFLSPYTVSTHRGNILQKTGFKHISELINDFRKRGLL
ncbi:MAG: LuxR C-terminal-related transcriptional regulator [Lentimicrobium sp.]